VNEVAEKTVPVSADDHSGYNFLLMFNFVHASLFLQLCTADDCEAAVKLFTALCRLRKTVYMSANQSDSQFTVCVKKKRDKRRLRFLSSI